MSPGVEEILEASYLLHSELNYRDTDGQMGKRNPILLSKPRKPIMDGWGRTNNNTKLERFAATGQGESIYLGRWWVCIHRHGKNGAEKRFVVLQVNMMII